MPKILREQKFSKRQRISAMTILGHKTDLRVVYQPNIKILTTQTIFSNDVHVFVCLCFIMRNNKLRNGE